MELLQPALSQLSCHLTIPASIWQQTVAFHEWRQQEKTKVPRKVFSPARWTEQCGGVLGWNLSRANSARTNDVVRRRLVDNALFCTEV